MTKVMELKELKQELSHGDITKVAKAVGCHRDTVVKILSGERNADTTLGKKIVRYLETVAATNKLLKETA